VATISTFGTTKRKPPLDNEDILRHSHFTGFSLSFLRFFPSMRQYSWSNDIIRIHYVFLC